VLARAVESARQFEASLSDAQLQALRGSGGRSSATTGSRRTSSGRSNTARSVCSCCKAGRRPSGRQGEGAGRSAGRESAASSDVGVRRPAMTLSAAEIAEIMRLIDESSFDELNLEMNGVKLQMRRSGRGPGVPAPEAGHRLSRPRRMRHHARCKRPRRRPRRPHRAPAAATSPRRCWARSIERPSRAPHRSSIWAPRSRRTRSSASSRS